MAALRFLRAKTVAHLLITVLVGVSAAAAGSATLAAAARGRGPAGDAGGGTAAHQRGGSRLLPTASLPSPSVPVSVPAVTEAPAAVPTVTGAVSPALRPDRHRGAGRLSSPSVGAGPREARGVGGTLRGPALSRVRPRGAGALARRELAQVSQEASQASE